MPTATNRATRQRRIPHHLDARNRRTALSSFALAVVVALVASAVAPHIAKAATATEKSQELAILVAAHTAYTQPGALPGIRMVPGTQPVTGTQTTLPVLRRAVTNQGVAWLLVMLPGRPNGAQGWIEERGTVRAATSWRIVVMTTSRRVFVYRRGALVRTFRAVVGKPSTPTPLGVFFVSESVRMPPGSVGGPFALALSAHSDVLRTFGGGSGQIAIHGTARLNDAIGTASSHGCVRLADQDIRWMAAHIAPGVPVEIAR
jgi:lipoprotein-anchoring transpeptidase ErfK/SrfK